MTFPYAYDQTCFLPWTFKECVWDLWLIEPYAYQKGHTRMGCLDLDFLPFLLVPAFVLLNFDIHAHKPETTKYTKKSVKRNQKEIALSKVLFTEKNKDNLKSRVKSNSLPEFLLF